MTSTFCFTIHCTRHDCSIAFPVALFGEVDGAITDNGAAIEARPTQGADKCAGPLYLSRADLEKTKGNLDGAIADLTTAIQLGSGASGYQERADAREAKGDLDGALADLNSPFDSTPRPMTTAPATRSRRKRGTSMERLKT
jgi:tetratricopeptide (TPR) repeat protein